MAIETMDTINEAPARKVGLARLLPYLVGRYDLAMQRLRSRQALRDLDDRLLDDVGLTQADARREWTRRFWD